MSKIDLRSNEEILATENLLSAAIAAGEGTSDRCRFLNSAGWALRAAVDRYFVSLGEPAHFDDNAAQVTP